MTFSEALELKNSIPSPYMHKDVKMHVYITPKNNKDFSDFLNFYRTHKPTDENAKKFCSNGEYAVYGLGPRISHLFYEKLG